MAELLYRLGKASAKRAWIVIVAWAAVLGLAGGAFAIASKVSKEVYEVDTLYGILMRGEAKVGAGNTPGLLKGKYTPGVPLKGACPIVTDNHLGLHDAALACPASKPRTRRLGLVRKTFNGARSLGLLILGRIATIILRSQMTPRPRTFA